MQLDDTPAISRAAIVDDHPLFRAGLCQLLTTQPHVAVVIDVGSTTEAEAALATTNIDLAIIDVVVPPDGGVALVRALRRIQPRCRILALSYLDDVARVADMLRAGAEGFVCKTQPLPEILIAVETVRSGHRYLPPSIDRIEAEKLARQPALGDRLTQREREVFLLLVRGLTNDEISTHLYIARRTVEAHRHHVMHKLDARSLVDLVRLAIRHGLAGTG